MTDLQPDTVEKALTLERETATGWSTDSQEAFLAPLIATPQEIDSLVDEVAEQPLELLPA
jgi:hypothetical protein